MSRRHHDEEDDPQQHNAEPLLPVDGMFTDLFEAIMEPPAWIIKDLLPKGLTLILGPPKLAEKSTMATAMALLVAGIPCRVLPTWLSQVDRDGPVLVFSSEATAGELRHMVEEGMGVLTAEEHTGAIHVADDPGSWRLDDPRASEQLMYWISKMNPRLVVIDVFRDFHSMDEKESAAISRMLRPVRKWAKDTDSSVLLVHHVRKLAEGQSEYTQEDARGSSALIGMADGIIVISPKDDGTKLISTTFKRAGSAKMHIQFGTWGKAAREILGEHDKRVIKALEAGATSADDLASGLKMAKQAVLASLAKLRRNGLLKEEVK